MLKTMVTCTYVFSHSDCNPDRCVNTAMREHGHGWCLRGIKTPIGKINRIRMPLNDSLLWI